MHPQTAISHAFFPHFCVGCQREGSLLCRDCRQKASASMESGFDVQQATPLDAYVCALPYGSPLPRRLLQAYKYERLGEARREVAALFGLFVHRHAPALHAWTDGALVMPVPMHPFRQALRGGNQADVLAATLVREAGGTPANGLLGKRFRLKRQAELGSAAERRRNAQGSIVVRRRFPPGSRFVLVDDVATTCSTLRACASALKAAGAGEVRAVTFLRG